MAAKSPSVRSLLMTTTPDAPYSTEPTYVELLRALERAADHDLTAPEAAALVERSATYRAWLKRRDALRTATLSHDLKATPQGQRVLRACHCATCGKWRQELQRLHDAQRAAQPSN